MKRALVLFAVCTQLSALTPPKDRVAPRFTVNLDLPPKQRWGEVIHEYSGQIEQLLAFLEKYVPSEALDVLGVVGGKVETAIPYPYNQELVGIAESLKGVNIGDVILANTLYEITAWSHGDGDGGFKACTSIVAEDTKGVMFHARNLDYSLVKLLSNLTITVDFQRGGATVYTGTTFAGFIGLLTGQKPHGYTISLNERDRGEPWMNAIDALADGLGAVAAFRIRDALASEEFDYEKALAFLTDTPLIAPCYIIIGGVEPSQGAVVTRDRNADLDLWEVDVDKGAWFVVETNYDHWKAPPPDDDRRTPAIKAMNEVGRAGIGAVGLFDVLSTPPVLNNRTTYTVVMSAAQPEIYNTLIRN